VSTLLASHPNFRELPRLQTVEGRHIARGRIYRSGAIGDLPDGEEMVLTALRIATICDLRSTGEVDAMPGRWSDDGGVRVVACDVLDGIRRGRSPWPHLVSDPSPSGARAAMVALYEAMPAAAGAHIVTIMRLIADGGAPLLIHCTAGKDRTGFVVAALLDALGAPRAAICEDYLRSAGRQGPEAVLGTRRLAEARVGTTLDDGSIDVLMSVQPDFLAASWRVVDGCGGVDAYLARFGADEALIADFRGRMLS
jgi:protein-tyrosine phosphatase